MGTAKQQNGKRPKTKLSTMRSQTPFSGSFRRHANASGECMYIYIYIYIHTCVYIYIYIYTHVYIYIYIYIYILFSLYDILLLSVVMYLYLFAARKRVWSRRVSSRKHVYVVRVMNLLLFISYGLLCLLFLFCLFVIHVCVSSRKRVPRVICWRFDRTLLETRLS